MKKIILILFGISLILSSVIFILYKNNQSKTEEVVDIFKEEISEEKEYQELEQKEELQKEELKTVIVDIKGMIKKPGVYEVGSTSRVNDVITLAGGLKKGADTTLINLAKLVEDEMTIIIPSSKEIEEKYKEEVCICNCPEITNDACIEEFPTEEEKILVNINTASKEELTKVPGIGESKADSIIKHRKEHGDFKSTQEIKTVSGIGESLFEKIKDYITV